MADFQESLTIRIRGDSSEFVDELDRVVDKIGELDSQLSSFDSLGRRIGSVLDRVGQMTQPLGLVSQAIARISQQLTQLSAQPVTLNVQPALAALQVLQGQIAATIAQLMYLNALSVGFGGFGGSRLSGFAQGGLVQGRPGMDRVPAMLTAGEFVIREPMVHDLGVSFLSALNEFGAETRSGSRTPFAGDERKPATTQVTNFGGVHIEVNQTTDLSGVLRELQAGGVRLRNRRG